MCVCFWIPSFLPSHHSHITPFRKVLNVESVEQGRFVSAPMVAKVSTLRGSSKGTWLDVGTGIFNDVLDAKT